MNEILKFFAEIFSFSKSSEPVGLLSLDKTKSEISKKAVIKKTSKKNEINISELMRHSNVKSALK